MRLSLELLDSSNRVQYLKEEISLPAFLKYAIMAGQGPYTGFAENYFRGFGLFLYKFHHFSVSLFDGFLGFKEVKSVWLDPTEKAQFSNIVGRAIADFISRKHFNAIFTHSYEAAMYLKKEKITGERPDFYCVTPNRQFAVEAKGYSCPTISLKEMEEHKIQSRTGPLAVHFSLASVTFNIYNNIECKCHDPVTPDSHFDKTLNESLADMFYISVIRDLNNHFSSEKMNLAGTNYVAFEVSRNFWFPKSERCLILVDSKIPSRISHIERDFNSGFEINEGRNYFVDKDGIGVLYEKNYGEIDSVI